MIINTPASPSAPSIMLKAFSSPTIPIIVKGIANKPRFKGSDNPIKYPKLLT